MNLLNIDNLIFMASLPDNHFDLAIVDPQTGQDEGKRHASRDNEIKQRNGNTLNIKTKHRIKDWDLSPPPQKYYDELFRVSKYQIIFCENQLSFTQKSSSPGRIIWNLLRDNDFSACQIMWTNLINKIDYFEFLWNGMIQGTKINSRKQQGNKQLNERRIHPSQKPVIMYRHLLRKYAKPGWTIFDSHAGSGSLAIACLEEGLDFTGTEIDKDIHNDASTRINNYQSAGRLF